MNGSPMHDTRVILPTQICAAVLLTQLTKECISRKDSASSNINCLYYLSERKRFIFTDHTLSWRHAKQEDSLVY
jgi:hypothetical protein